MAKAKLGFTEKRKKELTLLGVALVAIIGISYAWLTQTITSTNTNVIVAGNLLLTLTESSQIVGLPHTAPISDNAGLSSDPYTFTVTNSGSVKAKYSVYLDDTDWNGYYNSVYYNHVSGKLSASVLDYNLRIGNSDSNTTINSFSSLSNPRLIATNQVLAPGESLTYNLRVWIDKSATNEDCYDESTSTYKYWAGKIRIEATQYYNPTIPTGN